MKQKVKKIYLDYAATTPLDPLVKKAMEPYLADDFGNPSSIHSFGRSAKIALEDARKTTARIFNCRPSEIIFTGSGTESINLAILGAAYFLTQTGFGSKKGHIITTKIEHHAVLHSVQALEKDGFEATYLDVDKNGLVDLKKLKAVLRTDTILVSIMYANNEIGTIEPIAEISKVIRNFREESRIKNQESGKTEGLKIENCPPASTMLKVLRAGKLEIRKKIPFFHVDACQAAGYLDLNVEKLGVDLMSVNGSKVYGPKGVGALYVRSGIKLEPIIYGGGQENNLRSGTENVAGIVGFAKALEIAQKMKEKECTRLIKLRDYFIREVLKAIPDAILNGDPLNRLPNNVNISIPGMEGDAAVLYLDEKGVMVSTGSACSSVSVEPSHVILALGRSREYALGSLRFSFGRTTTQNDSDYTLKSLIDVVNILRRK